MNHSLRQDFMEKGMVVLLDKGILCALEMED